MIDQWLKSSPAKALAIFLTTGFTIGATAQDPCLSETQRAEIWQREHQVNRLTQMGLRPMARNLTARDSGGLQSHFKNREDAAKLLGLLETFPSEVDASFSVRSLRRAKLDTGLETWKADLFLRLWSTKPGYAETGASIAIHFRPPVEVGTPWCQSLAISSRRHHSTALPFYRENGGNRGLPVDLHDNWAPGTPTALVTGGVYVEDINRDGCLDVLVTDRKWPENLRLYAGSGENRFRDITARAGLGSIDRADLLATFFDWDGDGWPDLLHGSTPWRNREGVFSIDSGSNLHALIGDSGFESPPVSYHPADFDLDGRIDLFVTRLGVGHAVGGSFLDGRSRSGQVNQLLKNLGEGVFRDVTEECKVDTHGFSSFSAAWFHANNDLYPDLYVIHEFGGGALFINREGREFEKRKLAEPGGDFGSMGIATADLNRDGNMDIYVSSMYSKAGKRVFQHLEENSYSPEMMKRLSRLADGSECYRGPDFSPAAQPLGIAEVGWGWGAAFADVNNDGWADLYATNGFVSRDRSKPDG